MSFQSTRSTNHDSISFHAATASDGAALWSFVQSSGTLELNSAYCYLLLAHDFGAHCLLATSRRSLVGAVLGYRPPREPESAFVWQLGVAHGLRGQGLGLRMLDAWYRLPANMDARWVTATVAEDNPASDRLFRAFARAQGTNITVSPRFTTAMFPMPHPPEPLYCVGPLAPRCGSAQSAGQALNHHGGKNEHL